MVEISEYTDLMIFIFEKTKTFKNYQIPLKDQKPNKLDWFLGRTKPLKKGHVSKIIHKGITYEIDMLRCYDMKGWYPGVKHRWINPITTIKYLSYKQKHNPGLMVFLEPDEKPNKPVQPQMNLERDEELSPIITQTYATSQNWIRYQRKTNFGMGSSLRILLYLVIGLILVAIIVVLFGGG